MLTRITIIFILISIAVFSLTAFSNKEKIKLLVFSKTLGYRHASIAAGKKAMIKLGTSHRCVVDTTEDAAVFNEKNLQQYDAVIFLSTTGNVLDSTQQVAFEKFIRSGKGFMGIHAATDTEYDWPWYVGLVGASFESHPKQQTARLYRTDKTHPGSAPLPDSWERFDEWYNFKNINPSTQPILKIDESSYTGGKNGENHAVSWYHEYDGGRSFYTALGHTEESYSEILFLEHCWGGIKYAAGIK